MAYWAKKCVAVLTRAAHWMAYFDLNKIEFSLSLMRWKCLNATEMLINVIKWLSEDHLHQKCQIQNYQNKGRLYVGYFYDSVNLNWTAQNPQLGRGLDIAALDPSFKNFYRQFFFILLDIDSCFGECSSPKKTLTLRSAKTQGHAEVYWILEHLLLQSKVNLSSPARANHEKLNTCLC